jgi:O-antigen ligase
VLLSCLVGLYYGQSVSQMLRDVRYPLYYGLFFVAASFFDGRHVVRLLSVLMASAGIVGVRYIAEFLGVVDLSVAGQFHRVAYIEGLVLPMGVLTATAIWMFWEGRFLRVLSLFCVLPAGLALMLTVGRGMWISVVAGLLALSAVAFRHPGRRRQRVWPILAIPVVVLSLTFVFQRATGTSIGAHAGARVAGIGSDQTISGRIVSYGITARKWLERPLLGHGHGAVVTFPSRDDYGPIELTVGGVDSLYLTVGLRMGIAGVAAFLWIYARGLKTAYRFCRSGDWSAERVFCATFVGVYTALLVYSAGDSSLFHNRLIFLHATMLAAVARVCQEAGPTVLPGEQAAPVPGGAA